MAEAISNMNQNLKKVINTRVSTIRLDDDGILRMVYFPGSEETLEDAEANHAALIEVSGSKKRPLFINSGYQKSVSREARIYYTKNAPEVVTALAGLITSPFLKVLSNIYIRLNKTINNDFPLKFFTSEAKAFDWLRKYLD